MSDTSLTVKRTVNAPIDRVWQAWTDPAELKRWYGPAHMTTPVADVDLKVGGAYTVTMKGEDGEHTVKGTFTDVQPPHKLAFTWQWEGSPEGETNVSVELNEVSDDQTEVVLRHTGFAGDESRDTHAQGWESTMDALEKHLD